MKSSAVALSVLLTALVVVPAFASAPSDISDLKPLRLLHGDPPVFPHDMVQLGVREGEVRIAFSVDVDGNVDDCLAIAYTHPEFARVSIGALKRWRFEPARFRGEPIAAVSELTVTFEMRGTVVVSLTSSESIAAMMYALTQDHDEYRPRTLKELDRIPTPIATPSPAFPARLAKMGTSGHVTVSFFIDETGAVRLPSVDSTDDAELGACAIGALRNWKFEPPTCRGRPVLVRATQRFNFHPPKAPTPAANSST